MPLSKTIYVQASNAVLAIRAIDGKVLWTTPLASPPQVSHIAGKPSLAVTSGSVYVVRENAVLALNTTTGKMIWTTPLSDAFTDMLATQNFLYIATVQGLYAFNPHSGVLVWRQTVSSGTFESDLARLTFANSSLYLEQSGNVSALQPATGQVIWQVQIGSQRVHPLRLVGLTAAVGFWNFSVVGFNPQTGTQLWSIKAPDGTMEQLDLAFATQDTLYLEFEWYNNDDLNPVTHYVLGGYNLATGKALWSVDEHDLQGIYTFISGPATQTELIGADGYFTITGPSNGDLLARSLHDGHILWQLPGTGTYGFLDDEQGQIYTQDNQSVISAFQAQSGAPLWTSPEKGTPIFLDHIPYVIEGDVSSLSEQNLVQLNPKTGKKVWNRAIPPVSHSLVGGSSNKLASSCILLA